MFSRDRAAQLDLLLASLDRYGPVEETRVLWYASGAMFADGYRMLAGDREIGAPTPPAAFDAGLRAAVAAAGESVTFLCDDDVVFRSFDDLPALALRSVPAMVAFSLRLASAQGVWDWTLLPRSGRGYPGSVDGHTFRTAEVEAMLTEAVPNPTMLETLLDLGCERLAPTRPLLGSYREQKLVGVPANRVAAVGKPTQRGRQPAAELNRQFLRGRRLSVDRIDFSGVREPHHDLLLRWAA